MHYGVAFVLVSTVSAITAASHKQNVSASTQFRDQDASGNYQFGYDQQHGADATFHREIGSSDGVKTGSYGLRMADGRVRVVNYVADHRGFRANIRSNEQGVGTKAAASVSMEAVESIPLIDESLTKAVAFELNTTPASTFTTEKNVSVFKRKSEPSTEHTAQSTSSLKSKISVEESKNTNKKIETVDFSSGSHALKANDSLKTLRFADTQPMFPISSVMPSVQEIPYGYSVMTPYTHYRFVQSVVHPKSASKYRFADVNNRLQTASLISEYPEAVQTHSRSATGTYRLINSDTIGIPIFVERVMPISPTVRYVLWGM